MSDPFKKVAIGDAVRFAAQSWNAMLDAAKAYQQKGALDGSSLPQSRSSTIIRVSNATGNNLDRCSILGLNGPIFTPTDSQDAFLREIAFQGITPDITKHKRRYAVLLEPAPSDAGYGGARVVRAYLAGLCPVLVDIQDQTHEYANIVDNVTSHLASSRFGHARILWAEWEDSYSGYSTGVQWAIVMLGVTGSCVAVGKALTTITARSGSTYGSGQVGLYRSSTGAYGGATEEGPIETIDVLNACADTSPSGAISSGKYCAVAWDADDVAWVTPIECG